MAVLGKCNFQIIISPMQLLRGSWNLFVCLMVRSYINIRYCALCAAHWLDGGSPTVMAVKTRSPVTHSGDSSSKEKTQTVAHLDRRCSSSVPAQTHRLHGRAAEKSAASPQPRGVYCVNLAVPTAPLAKEELLSNRFGVC